MMAPRFLRFLAGVIPALVVLLGIAATSLADVERLPRDPMPAFQAIRLKVDAGKPDYTGSVRVGLVFQRATSTLRFHAQEMKLVKTVLRGGKGTPVSLKTAEGAEGLVVATAPRPIQPGRYTLEIDFTNEFDQRATSLYRLESGGNAYTFTQFEATDARLAFPCWDEPSFKFPYQLTLEVPAAHEAVTNTPIERTSDLNGVKTVVFQRTKPLPSYLLAIATGPLEYVPIKGTSIPARVVVPKGTAPLAQVAATMTPPILAALERYFGRPYPYEKLDLIAVPEFSPGAMENPGAITYGDRFILFDEKTMSTAQRRLFAIFTAHELAHMWFGDLVTMTWWDDLWLNESFAEWMGDKIAKEVHPDLQVEVRALEGIKEAMVLDARLSTRAIRQPVVSATNILQAADALTYKKGQAVLGMFERWMGPETFRRGVLAYLRKHEWGNAEAADLWNALSEAAGRDLHAPMATFLDQPGVPLVGAEVQADGRVRLTQRRFLNHGVTVATPSRWQIPVTLKYGVGSEVKSHALLLTDSSVVVTLPEAGGKAPGWVIPNGAAAYYRWSLDPPALQKLVVAAPKALEPTERIGLLQNLGALLLAGRLHGDEYLRLVAGFADDPRPEVIGELPSALQATKFAFIPEELEGTFATYVRRVLGPAAKRFGLDRSPSEEAAVSLVRPTLLAWLAEEGRDEAALSQAERLAHAFLADRGAIDPSLVAPVLRLSAIRGDAALFDEYQKRFEAAKAPTDRMPLLEALGNFRDPKLRERALAYALGPSVRPHEVFAIPQSMAGTTAYQQEVFEWHRRNYDAIVAKIPPVYAVYMPYFGIGCEEDRLRSAEAFYAKPEHSPTGTEVELKRMLETGRDCVGLRAREGPAVARYLQQLADAK